MHLHSFSLLGFGAWDHVCSLRLKPFRRMQVPYLGLRIYYVSVYFEFSEVLTLMTQRFFLWQRAGHAYDGSCYFFGG